MMFLLFAPEIRPLAESMREQEKGSKKVL
ncbi:hypothetical protein ELI_07060 [Erythrobacter litoralis HTCC2594]|uniref:Uncharacterized protein n=1 Tax=Erythrobacter litoralis (strain HTCC2594) TaxID=314225 RepID=Q2N9Y7_ERYLH|nr:hypothetical protein ELI_07060 [Erythrobacter litoralis HTCC2594]